MFEENKIGRKGKNEKKNAEKKRDEKKREEREKKRKKEQNHQRMNGVIHCTEKMRHTFRITSKCVI